MVLTPSSMLPLGTSLPVRVMEENLVSVQGEALSVACEQPLLVLFICPHCPFVKHIEPELTRLQADFQDRLQMLGICSNSVITHPQDGPEGMAAQARTNDWNFPYLSDPDQAVAKAFRAACTPDIYLFDCQQQLVYRGQLDASRPGNDRPLNGADLRGAITSLLEGEAIKQDQTASVGCNIKWHPGQEPDWVH